MKPYSVDLLPLSFTRLKTAIKRLPEGIAAEVLDFVEFLERKHLAIAATPVSPRQPGSARQQLIYS